MIFDVLRDLLGQGCRITGEVDYLGGVIGVNDGAHPVVVREVKVVVVRAVQRLRGRADDVRVEHCGDAESWPVHALDKLTYPWVVMVEEIYLAHGDITGRRSLGFVSHHGGFQG